MRGDDRAKRLKRQARSSPRLHAASMFCRPHLQHESEQEQEQQHTHTKVHTCLLVRPSRLVIIMI